MYAYRIVIHPKGKMEALPHITGSEEYITVFNGCIELGVDGKTFSLNRGDSIKFQADCEHSYKNVGNDTAELSMLIYYSK